MQLRWKVCKRSYIIPARIRLKICTMPLKTNLADYGLHFLKVSVSKAKWVRLTYDRLWIPRAHLWLLCWKMAHLSVFSVCGVLTLTLAVDLTWQSVPQVIAGQKKWQVLNARGHIQPVIAETGRKICLKSQKCRQLATWLIFTRKVCLVCLCVFNLTVLDLNVLSKYDQRNERKGR